MDLVALQEYTNTYPVRYAIKPRQPIVGKHAITAIETILTYDIISPYGCGSNVVSNPAQDALTMVGWGMIIHLAILVPGAASLTVQADLVDGTFTELDFSPIALAVSVKVQTVDLPIVPCFKYRVRLTGDGSTYTYHASLTDY